MLSRSKLMLCESNFPSIISMYLSIGTYDVRPVKTTTELSASHIEHTNLESYNGINEKEWGNF